MKYFYSSMEVAAVHTGDFMGTMAEVEEPVCRAIAAAQDTAVPEFGQEGRGAVNIC